MEYTEAQKRLYVGMMEIFEKMMKEQMTLKEREGFMITREVVEEIMEETKNHWN